MPAPGSDAPTKAALKLPAIMIVLLAVCAVLAFTSYRSSLPPPNGLYDALARCIASSTAKFYGAFWCPHCRNQKTMFGDAAQYLPYVECSTPDGNGELAVCKDAGVERFPTWVLPDGSRLTGEQTPATLAGKTGCPLPSGTP